MTEVPDSSIGPVLQPATAGLIDVPLDPADFGSGMFEPARVLDPEAAAEADQVRSDLDPKAMDDFEGLMTLGYLKDTVTVAGHKFVIQTPWVDDRIEWRSLHAKYIGTANFEPMWELLAVAAYVRRIDSRDAPEPLGAAVGPVETRLQWVKDSIFSQLVVRLLYNQCMVLDARERAVVEYVDGQSKA